MDPRVLQITIHCGCRLLHGFSLLNTSWRFFQMGLRKPRQGLGSTAQTAIFYGPSIHWMLIGYGHFRWALSVTHHALAHLLSKNLSWDYWNVKPLLGPSPPTLSPITIHAWNSTALRLMVARIIRLPRWSMICALLWGPIKRPLTGKSTGQMWNLQPVRSTRIQRLVRSITQHDKT